MGYFYYFFIKENYKVYLRGIEKKDFKSGNFILLNECYVLKNGKMLKF